MKTNTIRNLFVDGAGVGGTQFHTAIGNDYLVLSQESKGTPV